MIELMIAMVMGLVAIGAAVGVLSSSSQSSRATLAMAELQGRARIALDELSSGIRSAGYLGCAGSTGVTPALPIRQSDTGSLKAPRSFVQGFRTAPGSWSPAHPDRYSPPTSGAGVPVPGNDALMLEGGGRQGIRLARATTNPKGIDIVSSYPGLSRGAMALIGDCNQAEIFHIDTASDSAGGRVSLGTTAALSNYYKPDPNHPIATRVLPYRLGIYYVGDTTRQTDQGEPIRALYEHLYPYNDTRPVEIASGVEAMVVKYRQQGPGGMTIETSAQGVNFDAGKIIGVRVALLISATERVEGEAPVAFDLAGVSARAGVTNSPGFPADERIRRVFERTVTLRNRKTWQEP